MPFVPDPAPPVGESRRGWMPTNKWLLAALSAVVIVVSSGLESGFDDTEGKMAISLALPLIGAYIVPNKPTPGGVPDAK